MKQLLNSTLGPVWRRIRAPRTEAEYLDRLASSGRPVVFLQIGAHDGKTDDHLHSLIRKHRWKGILFEPVEYLFTRLVANYKGVQGLYFENKAVSRQTGTRKFYRLRPNSDGLPEWYDQLGSFDRQVVMSHAQFIPNIEKYLIEEDVECTTVEASLKAHGLKQVDVLLVDTEGADFEILKSIDFEQVSPKLIIYEHKHLSASDSKACRELLEKLHYRITPIPQSNNSVAVLRTLGWRFLGIAETLRGSR